MAASNRKWLVTCVWPGVQDVLLLPKAPASEHSEGQPSHAAAEVAEGGQGGARGAEGGLLGESGTLPAMASKARAGEGVLRAREGQGAVLPAVKGQDKLGRRSAESSSLGPLRARVWEGRAAGSQHKFAAATVMGQPRVLALSSATLQVCYCFPYLSIPYLFIYLFIYFPGRSNVFWPSHLI